MANKGDLVDHLADTLEGVTKKHANEAIDTIFGYISDTLASGEKVQIPGFGTFDVRARAARQGRNPQTGAAMNIPASNSVGFKAGKGLKDAVNS